MARFAGERKAGNLTIKINGGRRVEWDGENRKPYALYMFCDKEICWIPSTPEHHGPSRYTRIWIYGKYIEGIDTRYRAVTRPRGGGIKNKRKNCNVANPVLTRPATAGGVGTGRNGNGPGTFAYGGKRRRKTVRTERATSARANGYRPYKNKTRG